MFHKSRSSTWASHKAIALGSGAAIALGSDCRGTADVWFTQFVVRIARVIGIAMSFIEVTDVTVEHRYALWLLCLQAKELLTGASEKLREFPRGDQPKANEVFRCENLLTPSLGDSTALGFD